MGFEALTWMRRGELKMKIWDKEENDWMYRKERKQDSKENNIIKASN